jgi:hypothetical protein
MKSREPRKAVILPARLRTAGGWGDVRIRNISSRGMLLKVSNPLVRGSYLEIARGRYRYSARVAWTEGNQCGVQIRELIDIGGVTGEASSPAVSVHHGTWKRGSAERRKSMVRRPSRVIEFALVVVGLATAGSAVAQATFQHLSGVANRASAALAGEQ